jgi:hypothetical protein
MVWLTRVGLLAIVGAMGCAPPCLDAHVVAGASPSSSDLRPGTYHIVMRVISGPHAGKHTTGSLWLAPTSPGDRSAKTKKGPATTFGYNPRARLYGSITLDFTRIGIRLAPNANPRSRDPIYPGVLVTVPDSGPRHGHPEVFIASSINRRDGVTVLDGEQGVTLWPNNLRRGGFSGVFFTRTVQGVFCATRATNVH